MKTLLSLILAAVMAATAYSQTDLAFVGGTDTAPPTGMATPKGGIACALLLLATAAAGGAIIVWVYASTHGCCANKRLILERDCNCGTWIPIATNDVSEGITVTNKWMLFAAVVNSPTNDLCRFRIHITDIPEN